MLKLRNHIVEIQDQLGRTAGIDPAQDRYLSGYITACTDVLNTDIEE